MAPRAVVRDVGPGVVGRLLRDVIANGARVIVPADTGIVLDRRTDVAGPLVVLGGPTRLEGRVRGDVVVLGDLVLRPGAEIGGRAIVIGGVLANSTLAVVRGARLEFRDETFVASRTATGDYALDYLALARTDVPAVTLPGIFGLRIPQYDRVDGLSLAWGPGFTLEGGRLRAEPTVTYRSQLGAIDPGVEITYERTRRTRAVLDARRSTLSNEKWIYGDLVSSALALGAGIDMRNYYRADRAELRVERDFETTTAVVTPFVALATERSWSAQRTASAPSVPYSILNRADSVEGLRRPNPAVAGGRITSGIVGAAASVLRGGFTGGGSVRAELAPHAGSVPRFAQITIDGTVSVPTKGEQRIVAFAHGVTTFGHGTPSQRYAYLGGGGTVPTLDPLALGGDELAWIDGRYVIPLPFTLPLGNAPTVALRYVVGAAGVGRLPSATQNVGVRLQAGFLRLDYLLDPADPHRHDVSFGFGLR